MDDLGVGVYRCRRCKGVSLLFDANATYNKHTGMFKLHTILDGVYCADCNDNVSVDWEEPEDGL